MEVECMLCFYAHNIYEVLEISLITSQHLQECWKLAVFFAFLWTERLLFETLSLTLAKNHKLFNSTLCNVFLAPDLSKHYPKLAIKLGLSCSLVGSLVIGFIHYTFVYFLVIIRWGSNEVSYTQIKSLLSIEKSLIAAWGKLLSYLTLSVN